MQMQGLLPSLLPYDVFFLSTAIYTACSPRGPVLPLLLVSSSSLSQLNSSSPSASPFLASIGFWLPLRDEPAWGVLGTDPADPGKLVRGRARYVLRRRWEQNE